MNIRMLIPTTVMLNIIGSYSCEGKQITFINNTEWMIQIFERGFKIAPDENCANITEFCRAEVPPHACVVLSTFNDVKHEYTDRFITISPLQQYGVNDLHICGAAYKKDYVLSRDFGDRLVISSQPTSLVILVRCLKFSDDIVIGHSKKKDKEDKTAALI